MKYRFLFQIVLCLSSTAYAASPDFISKFIENSKLAYADNGYRVVHEKIVYASELDRGDKTIACQLEPGEYFVQLVTEPCLKMSMEVQGAEENERGIVSEKPEMRSAIAIFDVREMDNGQDNPTQIKLFCPNGQLCFPAKARLLVYQRIAY